MNARFSVGGDIVSGDPSEWDGLIGAGTDEEWSIFGMAPHVADDFGFLPLIIGGIAAVVGAVTSAATAVAATAGPIVAAIGGVKALADKIGGGVKAAEGLLKAAKGGNKDALKKLSKVHQDEAKRMQAKAIAKLAEVMIRARAGDVAAESILVGMQIATDGTVQRVAATGKAMKALGVVPTKSLVLKGQAKKKEEGKELEGVIKAALERAKKSPKWLKKPAPRKLPIKAMVKAAGAAGVKALKAESKKLPGGVRGYLVTAEGKPLAGTWVLNA